MENSERKETFRGLADYEHEDNEEGCRTHISMGCLVVAIVGIIALIVIRSL